MKEFKKIKSVCPVCLTKINAKLVELGNSLFVIKKCKKHGTYKVLISKDSKNYKKINSFYLSLKDDDKYKNYLYMYYNLFVTPKCTFDCRKCLSKKKGRELELEEIKQILRKFKGAKIAVWGGEATQRRDLPQIIWLISESGNTPALYTDGIKISNYNYLKKLKKNGLKIVHLEFEGFDRIIPEAENQKKIIQTKIKSLNNLKRLNIATGIQSTIIRGINENSMKDILNYTSKNAFVKSIFFKSHRYFCKSTIPPEKRLTTSDFLELIENQTNGKISKQDIYNFQVTMYLLYDFLNIKRCFYNRGFLLLRKDGGYIPITDILDLDNIQKKLCKCLKIKNQAIKKIIMLIKILPDTLNYKSIPICMTLFSMFIHNKIIHQRFDSTKINKKVIYISFGRVCDAYNFDFENINNCEIKEIFGENKIIKSLAISDLSREKDVGICSLNQ